MKHNEEKGKLDRHSFALGMVAAFCECVAADAKPLALSPPLSKEDFDALREPATDLINAHRLSVYYETNADLPEDKRVYGLVIYARQEELDAYLRLRANGENPGKHLEAFAKVLGYGPRRIHTGYDAYRDLFR